MKAVAPVLAAALLSGLLGGEAHRKTERGNRLYGQSDWDGAMSAYADAQGAAPQAPELPYDIGNVLYRKEDWTGAAGAYGRALAAAPPDLAGRVAYNLGNAHFKDGGFEEAVQAYRRALRSAPADADAKRNLELALQALDREKKKEDDSDKKKDEQKEDDKKDDGQKKQEQKKDEPSNPDPNEKEGKGAGEKPQPQPSTMSPEQARQLIDRLSDQERENVKREALRRAQAAPSRTPEKDW